MKHNNPLISVVIPTYNRAGFIKKAIDCVLAQTYQNFELIIVDDYSKDATREIILSIPDNRIRLIEHEKNMGAATARNTGIRAAKGTWIAFLDSDDVWTQSKLEQQVKVIPLLTNDYGVIHCGINTVDHSTGKFLTKRMSRGNINELVRYNIGIIPPTPTMLIRKDILFEVGLFDDRLPAHQESELCLRIAQKYKFRLVDEYLVIVTRNHDQIRGNPSLYVKAKEMILEKHEALLSDELIYSFSNIIAGFYIVNKDFVQARKYLKNALEHKVKIKSIISYSLISISPGLTNLIYRNNYKRKGLLQNL